MSVHYYSFPFENILFKRKSGGALPLRHKGHEKMSKKSADKKNERDSDINNLILTKVRLALLRTIPQGMCRPQEVTFTGNVSEHAIVEDGRLHGSYFTRL